MVGTIPTYIVYDKAERASHFQAPGKRGWPFSTLDPPIPSSAHLPEIDPPLDSICLRRSLDMPRTVSALARIVW